MYYLPLNSLLVHFEIFNYLYSIFIEIPGNSLDIQEIFKRGWQVCFPEENLSFKWLLVYQDHFTKFVRIRALKTKTATEVADVLLNIFWDMGAPFILQYDNGREF